MAANRFIISSAEYGQKRHVFDLCRWINAKLGQMEKEAGFDEVFFERRGENVKKLLEEAIPLSRLGLHLTAPGNNVYVTCCPGNQPFDAEVEITGFGAQGFKVEVTTTETELSTLRRQALSRIGTVPLTGPISGLEMTDVAVEEHRCIELMFERMRSKVESKRYGSDTAILVYFSEYLPIGLQSRAELVRRTHLYLMSQSVEVRGVYYCYTVGRAVDEVPLDGSVRSFSG